MKEKLIFTFFSLCLVLSAFARAEDPAPVDPQRPVIEFQGTAGIEVAPESAPRFLVGIKYLGHRDTLLREGEMTQWFAFSAESGLSTEGKLSLLKLSLTPLQGFTCLDKSVDPSAIGSEEDRYQAILTFGKLIYETDLDLGIEGSARIQVMDLGANFGGFHFTAGSDIFLDGMLNQTEKLRGLTGHIQAGFRLPIRVMEDLLIETNILAEYSGMGGFTGPSNGVGSRFELRNEIRAILKDAEFIFSFGYTEINNSKSGIRTVRYPLRVETRIHL